MILPVYTFENPILRQPAVEVVKDQMFTINNEQLDLKYLVDCMYETMYAKNGIGLAAPQIGIPAAIFVISVEIRPGVNFKQTFINPKIIYKFGVIYTMEEGCLSVPGINEKVDRFGSILIHYYDINFNKKHQFYHDLESRVIQHEYDHLQGVLFTDYSRNAKV